MITIFEWNKLNQKARRKALARAKNNGSDVTDRVKDIIAMVRRDGDAALCALTATLDGYNGQIKFVDERQLDKAVDQLTLIQRKALERAIANVTSFHKAQMPGVTRVETQPGVVCELYWKPIERVGLYIPAGSAPLVSTLMMCAIPAFVAGCSMCVLCVPPRKDGTINSAILAAARLCGVKQILPVGGAQAIAAMAFGTATVPKVDKIFGPGNSYVTRAKQLVAQEPDGAAIDMPAGPSEVMVIAGAKANPSWIAADLLAQAEHGADSQALLVTTSLALAEAVQKAVDEQVETLSRAAIVRESLKHSRILVVTDWDKAVEVCNQYAPEHLILPDDETASLLPRVLHAGSVFVGPWSPETAGDYASGTNHVLPTYGAARAYGSLSLKDFMKSMSVQTLTRAGLKELKPILTALADMEGLDAHARAVILRMEGA